MTVSDRNEALLMTQRGKPPEGYYTATTTRKKLGNITDGMLRSYIQRGLIERTVPPGRKQGFYKREDVDKLARTIDDLGDKLENTGTQFQLATKEDIPECVDLLISIFGGGNTTPRRQSWLGKNPEVCYLVRSKGKVVGCAFVLPLTVEKIHEIFKDQGSASITGITSDDIQELHPDRPAHLYLVSVGVKIGSELAKRTRGQTLIRGLIKVLFSLGKRGISIDNIAGRSETKDGINLMKHMGFTEVESITFNRNFIIEVKQSGIPEIVRYKKLLSEWKETNTHNTANNRPEETSTLENLP